MRYKRTKAIFEKILVNPNLTLVIIIASIILLLINLIDSIISGASLGTLLLDGSFFTIPALALWANHKRRQLLKKQEELARERARFEPLPFSPSQVSAVIFTARNRLEPQRKLAGQKSERLFQEVHRQPITNPTSQDQPWGKLQVKLKEATSAGKDQFEFELASKGKLLQPGIADSYFVLTKRFHQLLFQGEIITKPADQSKRALQNANELFDF